MRSPFVWLVVGALLGAAAPVVVAQAPPAPAPDAPLPPRYEVEVLVFANREFDSTEERFDQAPNGFDGDGADTLREAPVFDDTNFGSPAPQTGALEPLDPLAAQRAEALRIRPLRPEELKLGAEYRKLQSSGAYEALLHMGWVQPGLPEADAEPFDLKVLGILNPSGTIRVHLAQFLHITLDLTYQADAAGTPALATNDALDELVLAPRYHLVATRNARIGGLHYFDHPAFGVLVRVTPIPTQDAQGRRPAA